MAAKDFICSLDAVYAYTDEGNPPKSVVLIGLSDSGGAFTKFGFVAADEAKHEILAVALAAVNNQSQVDAFVDDPATTLSRQCYQLGFATLPLAQLRLSMPQGSRKKA